MAGTILVVDDEQDLVETLRYSLEREGYATLAAKNGAAAMTVLGQSQPPDLVLLDWMLPDMSGAEVCRNLRMVERTRRIPVIMVSARSDEIDRVVGVGLGADDDVTKAVSVRPLLLRVRAILRRRSGDGPAGEEAQFERLRVDLEGHQVWVDEQRVGLTALEFRLLTTLLARRGRVQTREMLLNDVWGMQVDVTTRTVDTHVQRLRKKLGDVGHYIESLRGVGYRLPVPRGRGTKAIA